MKTIFNIMNGFFNLFKQKLGFVTKEKKELYEKRLNICLKCKYLDEDFCMICGCYVYAKTKVDFDLDENGKSISGCPKKYW